MSSFDARVERLREAGVIAILRKLPEEALLPVTDALVEAGITALEITMDSAAGAEAIRTLRARHGDAVFLGAGTVMHEDQIRAAVAAGAEYLLSPHLDVRLVQVARAHGRPMVPGVLTPTEIAQAIAAGAPVLKLFPAGPLGVGYLKDLLGPFAGTAFLPTGGLTADNLAAFLEAGAVGVGLGSSLVPKHEVAAQDWAAIRRRAEDVMARVKQARAGRG
ncbi:2-dehydro-3-deoxy-phosphogluconate aldolase [Alicyclobacillus cellulosilyticus]|uniref:2-dehydro-3-deoxy-phosphogluconate aldolase n=1 Tax=Alicyclobacillus cellulosilyticus TaxID=1003997 RepID=A0A917KEB2_9BACL|nr:bifunctional 4-hydroxy-2-oxoglutarate aldolase/2-dehydro-3-deoxy-phosphogluconate aldolase [Alicyclobacillus cellulosilyticus]GGJ08715.1 2-dehydro-3-deoxy-phosphogluconate aldolase [Alicyclobacillus cellulosilyticus]